MKKFFTLLLLCVCLYTPSHADEGMWLPSLIGERIKDMKRKGSAFWAKLDEWNAMRSAV